jgi:transcriptional regulator with XRE-family HTH domain
MEKVTKLLGSRIRYLRNLRRMTQEQLGEKANLNYKYLGAIERGEKNIRTDSLSKIAAALEVKLYELFTFENESDDTKLVKTKIDDLLKSAGKKEFDMICRVIEAILK